MICSGNTSPCCRISHGEIVAALKAAARCFGGYLAMLLVAFGTELTHFDNSAGFWLFAAKALVVALGGTIAHAGTDMATRFVSDSTKQETPNG